MMHRPIHAGALFLAGALTMAVSSGAIASNPSAKAVLTTYADIAHAAYEDSLVTAKALQTAVEALIASPSPKTMDAARAAWLAARDPYMQTEVYRFGNPIVDDWEGKVNAWPLDEGLLDYVDASYGTASEENPLYTANVIAQPKLQLGGQMVDATKITKALIADTLHEGAAVEANVATGYHAVEFLLWGQDLNGNGPGAGARPWTDYAKGEACTNGHCERRAEYLSTATALLVDDLMWMTAQWASDGEARKGLVEGEPQAGLATIVTGMGSLSYGELAGERMKLGLMLHDPEEEHDCFADNTHNSHYYDVIGILNVYHGQYKRIDGSMIEGPSLEDLVAAKDKAVAMEVAEKLALTEKAMGAMKARAEAGEAYDQMIGEGNTAGNAAVQAAIDGLTAQTAAIEKLIPVLGLDAIAFEGSDSLDNPAAVFQ